MAALAGVGAYHRGEAVPAWIRQSSSVIPGGSRLHDGFETFPATTVPPH